MRIGLVVALVFPGLRVQEAPPPRVDFARDVRPILEAACVKCHGSKKPKAQLRLDAREPAMRGGLSGPAILPGKGAESPLVRLLTVEDESERMPQKAPALPAGQIELLRRWIDEGAVWPDAAAGEAKGHAHWAYVKPRRPSVPPVRGAQWVRTPVDAFVLARLEREGLSPSPEASRETLLRRVSLDLVGLPPSTAEIDAFLADAAPDAYERVVDRLLASPHYGERWARPWLDLARYADTNGFNFDTRRTMWKWRDWVVDALNRDLPFDRFTIEQIAGDLLPGATLEQQIATGFHRNTLTNEEGGTDQDEARWHTLVDRVATTSTVWLGSTLACAQCHNHKYDPFSQKDFYRFLAFFETSEEPKIELLTPEQREEQTRLRREIARQEEVLRKAPGLDLPDHVEKALGKPFDKRSNTQRNDVTIYCRSQMPHSREIGAALLELYEAHQRLDGQTALVLREKKKSGPPTTHVRIKGGFTNVGEEVSAGVPESLHPFPSGAPLDRLGLAQWLVSEENPLVARVTVNRFWDVLFGRPLLETSEDLGTQSPEPSHPELLDWLATEFVRQGWSMKAILRTLVGSATYRQSSAVGPDLLERDPQNRLLARGPRFRMEAEMIRDAALAAGGLLSLKRGGPSVFPLQADTSGVVAINKVDTAWAPSPGEDRYRRGLYTHWRRTSLFAAYATFDAPSREVCTVRRPRTNTPLQALSGLNDPAHFDAARGLARRMMREASGDIRERAAYGFRLCTARRPDAEVTARLAEAWRRERAHFGARPEAARAIFADAPFQPSEEERADAAAWTMVANVLLNLDETLTKE